MTNIEQLLSSLYNGDRKALARSITIVENNLNGAQELLASLKINSNIPVIGITGPPGAGKSTLVNELLNRLSKDGKKIGVIAVDPTSPFNYGSLLGDRLRMSDHFNDPNIFIRSVATRGSLGGLSAEIIEITDVMRAANFDYIFVETVGVGQSEVEIVGLANTTILIVVPEAGDEIQTIKSGVMEIADIFVVNKADREGAGVFHKNLTQLVHSKEASEWQTPVIKATATTGEGCDHIIQAINKHAKQISSGDKQTYLLTEKAYRLIQNKRMRDVSKKDLIAQLKGKIVAPDFNLYQFVQAYD